MRIIRKIKLSIQGFTLSELLVSIAISSIVALMAGTLLVSLLHLERRYQFLEILALLKLKYQQVILTKADWEATVSGNQSMMCFRGPGPTSCLQELQNQQTNGPEALNLYTAGSLTTPLFDSTLPYNGFDLNGASCNTFGQEPPTSCVLQPRLNWHLECQLSLDPTCESPLVVVDMTFNYKGPSLGAIRFSTYGFHIVTATFPLTVSLPCGPAPAGTCAVPQKMLCISGNWACQEFGP